MSTYKAFLLVTAVLNEREHGTKHHRSSTGELLTDIQDILIALRENDLEIQPCCQACGKPMELLPLNERYCDECRSRRRRFY